MAYGSRRGSYCRDIEDTVLSALARRKRNGILTSSATEIALATGVNVSSVYSILHRLVEQGTVERTPVKKNSVVFSLKG